MSDHGRKDDQGKDPWELAPWDAFRAIVRVMAHGREKYGARNWEKGMAWSRLYGALQRHLTSWWEGEPADPETRYSHLWHAGCCIVFLIAFELRGIGDDDRPRMLPRIGLAPDPASEAQPRPAPSSALADLVARAARKSPPRPRR